MPIINILPYYHLLIVDFMEVLEDVVMVFDVNIITTILNQFHFANILQPLRSVNKYNDSDLIQFLIISMISSGTKSSNTSRKNADTTRSHVVSLAIMINFVDGDT